MDLEQMKVNSKPAITLLKAMANEQRLFILCMLHGGEMTVGELLEQLELSQSALSQHLAWLRRDGLVATRKNGLQVYYSLASDEVKALIALLHSLYCQ